MVMRTVHESLPAKRLYNSVVMSPTGIVNLGKGQETALNLRVAIVIQVPVSIIIFHT